MSVSYSLFPIKFVHENKQAFIDHAEAVDCFGEIDFERDEAISRYPSRSELLAALERVGIDVDEKVSTSSEAGGGYSESYLISDEKSVFEYDLTVTYEGEEHTIKRISGITSDLRLLFKLAVSLSEEYGSYYIFSPYELIFVDAKQKNDAWAIYVRDSGYID